MRLPLRNDEPLTSKIAEISNDGAETLVECHGVDEMGELIL
jgi:hypothetical protein